MPTPSIQTLRADAQQVLNLDSISAVRSVVAATLANANAGTPLNPNLTTQQLWNEFYQIVTQPKSDIESIIANQLMKFLFAPPAPGGAGADKQVIFNDGGVLAGDAGLTFNKTTDLLTVGSLIVPGNVQLATVSTLYVGTLLNPKLKVDVGGTGVTTITEATITGDLTVATDRLKVVTGSTAIQTGATTQLQVGTTSWPSTVIGKSGSRSLFGNAGEVIIWNEAAAAIGNYSTLFVSAKTGAGATTMGGLQIRAGIENASNSDGFVSLWTSNNTAGGFVERYKIDSTGVATWSNVGGVAGTAMTLNATGLGVGVVPELKLRVDGPDEAPATSGSSSTNGAFRIGAVGASTNLCVDAGVTTTSGVYGWFQARSRANYALNYDIALQPNGGNLLVGTTTNTDAYRTNIQFSGTSVNGLIVKNLASTGGPVLLYLHDSAQTVNTATVSAEYTDSTTQRWRLYKNGGLANYQANNVNLSDVRTKTDIKPIGSYWNKIKSLEVVTFKYKDQTHSDDNIGLIAQQVESVAPELVDADGFGNTPEDGVPLKTIYTTDLYHAAIKALQEAMTRIEALEAKLA